MTDMTGREVRIDYTNWKGVRAWRTIRPAEIRFASHRPYHPDEQWLLRAYDVDKGLMRDFAMRDVHVWQFSGSPAASAEAIAGDLIPDPVVRAALNAYEQQADNGHYAAMKAAVASVLSARDAAPVADYQVRFRNSDGWISCPSKVHYDGAMACGLYEGRLLYSAPSDGPSAELLAFVLAARRVCEYGPNEHDRAALRKAGKVFHETQTLAVQRLFNGLQP